MIQRENRPRYGNRMVYKLCYSPLPANGLSSLPQTPKCIVSCRVVPPIVYNRIVSYRMVLYCVVKVIK